MDTDRLRYFCTVAQTSNLHRASELLHITPAALSKAIRQLEEEMDIKLTAPSGRGIVITDLGKRFYKEAERLLKEFEALKHLQDESRTTNHLRIGSFEVFTTHALTSLITKSLPDFTVELHELVPGRLEESLVNQLIDIGITYIPIPKPEIDFLKVSTLSMGVFTAKGSLGKMPLSEVPFAVPITPVHGAPNKVVGLDGWPDHLFPRFSKYKVTMMESALELARKGLAACYIPKFVARLHNEKVHERFHLHEYSDVLPIAGKFTQQPVYLVKRKSDIENQVIKKIAANLRLLCSM